MSTIDLQFPFCYCEDMYDLVTLGDITLDLFFKGECLTEEKAEFKLTKGEKYPVDKFHVSVGGGGANIAVGVAHFGHNTAVCGKVGENVFKQIVIQQLIRKHVSTEFLLYDNDYYNLSSILLAKTGERVIIHYVCHSKFDISALFKSKMAKSSWIYLGNIRNLSIGQKRELLNFFKKKGAKIALNLGISDCKKGLSRTHSLIEFADIFFLNTREFSELINKDRTKINFRRDCRSLLGIDELTLVLTDGANGSYLYDRKEVRHEPAIKLERIVDCTGAGDAFVSGFLGACLKGEPMMKAQVAGTRYATRIISKLGAQ